GAGRLRRGAAAGGPSVPHARQCGRHPAPGLRDAGDLRGLLPRHGRGHRGLSRRAADPPADPPLSSRGDFMSEAVAVTRTLAEYVVRAQASDTPEAVRREAVRSLLNWAGCAIGGSR